LIRIAVALNWKYGMTSAQCSETGSSAPHLVISLLSAVIATFLMICGLAWSPPAQATPAFAQQTGQPCSECHVGAFGPQLKPYGRDFKLFGYVNGDGKSHLPQLAVIGLTSFNHTNAAQSAAPAPHYSTNDNLALDQLSLLYGGRLVGGAGAFAEVTYDGVRRTFTIDNVDVKRAFYRDIGDRHILVGVDVNNRPTVQDIWNSTPTWGFPYNASVLAPTPSNRVILDGALAQRVVGAGLYAMWDDLLYTEFNAYSPIDNRTAGRLGLGTTAGTDAYTGVLPYWRVALQHDFDGHYLEIGGYGISGRRYPGGVETAGTDRITDVALDATYQYVKDPKHFVSSHATWIHENDDLDASRVLTGSRASNHLDTVRGDLSYSYDNTWTPSAQLFRTTGSRDPLYFGGLDGNPDSEGYIVELAYVPFGKIDSPAPWVNARFTVQWVGYTQFDGASKGATRNDTLYISSRFAFAPFGAFVQR
jgi:hypothetical protein